MYYHKSSCKGPAIRFAITNAILIISIICGNTFGATQLSQFGITWTFNKDYQTGQFANGDYWVIGPVTITDIDPSSTSGGRVMNGSMINPSPRYGQLQGYDSATLEYSNSLNVALDVSSSNPLTVPVDSSLVSTISILQGGSRPQLRTCAILTVLDTVPPPGSFRPPYSGSDKTIKHNASELNYSLLGNLSPVYATPSLSSIERNFERPWIDHIPEFGVRFIHPTENMPDYGREISMQIGDGGLMLNLNFSNAQKETLLIRFVQLGIDLFGVVQDDGQNVWINNGGHASGRKWPILFAGLMLGDGEMMNIGRPDLPDYGPRHPEYVHFGEDDQTFYVSQSDINSGRYSQSDLGLPEWGIRHATDPSRDSKSWTTSYRQCCTANVWAGLVLSARIMRVKNLWNHDALFDYQDRYMKTETDGWLRQKSDFTENMWDTYRADFGAIWPDKDPSEIDTTPPLPPSDLTATDIKATSISLTWNAPPAASDGDTASGYWIYRDNQNLGSTVNTYYTDTQLTAETSYNYQVYSYDNVNNISETSAEGTFTTTSVVIEPLAVYYISPDGSDNNSGTTWSEAFRNLPPTLQRNAIYYFAGGTYPDYYFDDPVSGTEAITIKKASLEDHGDDNGWNTIYAENQAVFGKLIFTDTEYIIFDGNSPAETVIRCSDSTPGAPSTVNMSNSDNITIANCEIDGNFQSSGGVQSRGSCSLVRMVSCSFNTIDNCDMHDSADDGMELINCSNLVISDNRISKLHGCGTDGGCGPCFNGHSDGIEIFNLSNSELTGNFVHDIPSTSALFFGNWATSSTQYCRNLLIANNIFYNNLRTGFTAYIEQADNIRLYNNVFWGMADASYGGLSIGKYVTNLEMYNNIILSVNYSHIGGSYNASEHIGDYNFFGVSTGQYQEQANDIIGIDPGFVGVNGANGPLVSNITKDAFMLKETSPCIDAGTIVDLAYDTAGNARLVGETFDIGAYEYGTAGPDTTPPDILSLKFGENYVDIRFSEPVEETSAANITNYSINNNIVINYATLDTQNNIVTLETSTHDPALEYQITISNISDTVGNTMDQVSFTYRFIKDNVGHWSFNETSGTTSQDLSTFLNTANLINGAVLNGSGQVVLSGIDDAAVISMENMLASSGTIAMKFQQSDQTGVQYLFGHTLGTWSNRIQIYLEDGSLAVGLGDSHRTAVNIAQLNTGQTYLVVLTWDGSGYSLYLDGVSIASGSYTGLDQLSESADIGNTGNPNNRQEGFNGLIDEAWIYNYALTLEQIAQLLETKGAADALVGHWKFTETSGNTAKDSSGLNNTALLVNGPVFTGQSSVSFDGIDDAVEIPMANMQAPVGTVAIKFTPAAFDTTNYLFGHSSTSGVGWSDRIQLYIEQGNLMLGLGDSHTVSANIENLSLNQSYHVALTWEETTYNVYVDGVKKATGTYTGLNTLNTFADIGNNGNTYWRNEAFEGLVDEVWIYNKQLSSAQITDLALSKNYGYETLQLITTYWLGYHPGADIAPPGGDGVVNILDFAELTEHWDPEP